MSNLFEFDKELCTACGACLLACIDQNDTDLDNGSMCRKVFTVESGIQTEYFSLGCVHCDNSPCIDKCPKQCFSRHGKFVILDNNNCIGCKLCEKVCEYLAISYTKDKKAVKCNGCVERSENSMDHPCARVCPTGALKSNLY